MNSADRSGDLFDAGHRGVCRRATRRRSRSDLGFGRRRWLGRRGRGFAGSSSRAVLAATWRSAGGGSGWRAMAALPAGASSGSAAGRRVSAACWVGTSTPDDPGGARGVSHGQIAGDRSEGEEGRDANREHALEFGQFHGRDPLLEPGRAARSLATAKAAARPCANRVAALAVDAARARREAGLRPASSVTRAKSATTENPRPCPA